MKQVVQHVLILFTIAFFYIGCETNPVAQNSNLVLSSKNYSNFLNPCVEVRDRVDASDEVLPSNLLVNPSAEEGFTGWMFYPVSGVTTDSVDNHVFYTRFGHIWQDVVLPPQSENKYVLLIGKAMPEYIVPGSITRHPYLYGYQMSNGFILEYMQGQNMLHTGDANEWQKLYGIFRIKNTVSKIRFFLMQASQVGDPPDGTKALFDDIELLIFDTWEEAYLYQQTYN